MPDERFFASTRGRIVLLLRRAGKTVDELARALGLTDNGVRAHLLVLERDGLVQLAGMRRGIGKPSSIYELSPAAERLFPKAYGRVLRALIQVLAQRLPGDGLADLLRQTGRQLAEDLAGGVSGSLNERAVAAAALLEELGGLVDIHTTQDRLILHGYSCPLAAVVPDHPQVCQLAEALLTEVVGAPVYERCDRSSGQPHCRFEISLT